MSHTTHSRNEYVFWVKLVFRRKERRNRPSNQRGRLPRCIRRSLYGRFFVVVRGGRLVFFVRVFPTRICRKRVFSSFSLVVCTHFFSTKTHYLFCVPRSTSSSSSLSCVFCCRRRVAFVRVGGDVRNALTSLFHATWTPRPRPRGRLVVVLRFLRCFRGRTRWTRCSCPRRNEKWRRAIGNTRVWSKKERKKWERKRIQNSGGGGGVFRPPPRRRHSREGYNASAREYWLNWET